MPESFLKPQKLTLCQIEYTILRDESAISKYLNRFRRGGKELENKSTYPESPQKDRRRHINRVAAILTGFYCSVITAMPALASSQTIIQGINRGTEQVWRILISIVAPIGAVALALQVIKIIWGGARAAEEAKSAAIMALQVIKIIWGGARAAEEAKSAAIKIIVAIAVVLMAPAIVSAIKSWFTAASWNFG